MKENELFTHSEFSNTILGRIIAIYSSQTVNEPFFLYKVFEKNTDELIFDNDHYIDAGTDSMVYIS